MNLKETYDNIAEDWHRQHVSDDWWVEGMNAFVSLVGAGASVLDVGCAGGWKSKALAERGLRVTGIDFSEKMIEIAKRHVPEATFFVCDMNEIDTIEETYDGLFLSAVLLHVPKCELVALLRKIVKRLRTGGLMYVAVKEQREGQPDEETKIENDLGYEYERFFSYFKADEMVRYLMLAGLRMTTAIVTPSGRTNWIQIIAVKDGV
jgi:SAM-dependent methyltransferase